MKKNKLTKQQKIEQYDNWLEGKSKGGKKKFANMTEEQKAEYMAKMVARRKELAKKKKEESNGSEN